VFSGQTYDEQDSDPDLEIYSGGFFPEADKLKMTRIRVMPAEQLSKSTFDFTDTRLPEMLFRYRARNYPGTLSSDEAIRWDEFCVNRLTGRQPGAGILLDAYFNRLQELRSDENVNQDIVNALNAYAVEKMERLAITQ